MTFLVESALRKAIESVVSGPNVRCAVAFWGHSGTASQTHADSILKLSRKADWKVICNLKMGGTNPRVIRTLRKRNPDGVKQCDILHAKVYLNDTEAVVASANASANGLGFEGIEQAGWIEAGIHVTDAKERGAIATWFNDLWNDENKTRSIKDADLTWAERTAWRRQQETKPSIGFDRYDLRESGAPLLTWWDTDAITINEKSVSAQGYSAKGIARRIRWGITVEHDKDAALLDDGTWILTWKKDYRSREFTGRLEWIHSSGILVKKAYMYRDEWNSHDVMLGKDTNPAGPFDVKDDIFIDTFAKLITDDRFKSLRAEDYEGPWYSDKVRKRETQRFWLELQRRYKAAKETS